jgi:GNAT superfamily N-acetyltransferase
MQVGMALGAAPDVDLATLERFHRDAIVAPNRTVLVGDRDGEIVAMAQIVRSGAANAPHRAEVQRVAVAAGARSTGIGRLLMSEVEEEARRQGLTLLWLTTHDGSDACAFYEAVGYTRLGVMPQYSLRPDGTVCTGAFYFRELPATVSE